MDALPKAAQELLQVAESAGWKSGVERGVDSGGSPFVTVAVGARSGERFWHYQITWHTRGTGTYRLFGKIVRTDVHYWCDAPSLRTIRETIAANSLTNVR